MDFLFATYLQFFTAFFRHFIIVIDTGRTVSGLLSGQPTKRHVAVNISEYFSIPPDKLFNPINGEKSLSNQTLLHHHRLLTTILETAVRWQLITSNPAKRVDPPKVERKEAASLDDDQTLYMLSLLEGEPLKYQTAIYIAVLGGLRLGEIVGLIWDDIDFDTGYLTISKSAQYTKELGSFKKSPKNETSNRVIKLPQIAINKLKGLYDEQMAERLLWGDLWVNSNNIMIKKDGSVMFHKTPSTWFNEWIKKTDLPKVTFHQLRHTNASILLAQGVDPVALSKRLGHSRPSTTTDIYGHKIKRVDERAAAVLDERFGNITRQ